MTNPIVLTVAFIVSVLVARRLVVRAWQRGRMDSDRAAMAWAVMLPGAIVIYAIVRGEMHWVIAVVAVVMFLAQFVIIRLGFRWLADGRIDPP
jgi:hypothetical protein